MTRSDEKAQRVLRRLTQIACDGIARRIAETRQVPLLEMLGDSRESGMSPARRELWTVIYDSVPEMSYPRLARIVERDHVTVMLGIEMRRAELDATLNGRAAPSWKCMRAARAERWAAKRRAA